MSLVSLYERNAHTTDKHGAHTYLEVYDKLFCRLRDDNNRILEIGVYKGDSLNLWAEYFTNSKIYGIDTDTFQIRKRLHERVKVVKENAYGRRMLEKLKNANKFNIIIDDGSHVVIHQKFVIKNYCGALTDDGILVIEDITIGNANDCCVPDIQELIDCFPEELKEYVYCVDMRRPDLDNNFLLICDKGRKI
jgi:hypothetical protein